MIETVFASNEAGQDGTAVFSIGVVEEALNVTFASNTLYCPLGEYAYDKEVGSCVTLSHGDVNTQVKLSTCTWLSRGCRKHCPPTIMIKFTVVLCPAGRSQACWAVCSPAHDARCSVA